MKLNVASCAWLVASGAVHATHAPRTSGLRKLSSPSFSGKITGLTLINSETDTKVVDLTNGTIIDVNSIAGMASPSFNINASFSGSDIGSVTFGHNGNPKVHTENFAMYSFCGNSGKNFYNCSDALGVGSHTVMATPYAKHFADGDVGTEYTVTFSILSSGGNGAVGASKNKDMSTVAAPVSPPLPSPTTVAPIALKPLMPVAVAIPVPAPLTVPSAMVDPINGVVFEPEMLNLTLSASKVDVTDGPATVNALVIWEDSDENGIMEFAIEAFAPDNKYQVSGSVLCTGKRQGTDTCNANLTFPQFIPDGNYTLQLLVYTETYASFFVSSDELHRQKQPHVIQVVNRNVDAAGPLLVDFEALVPTTVNVTTEEKIVHFQLVVRDLMTGIQLGYLDTIGPDGAIVTQGYFDATQQQVNVSKSGQPIAFNTTLLFTNVNRPGAYQLQVTAMDGMGNVAVYNATALQSMAFPSSIEVINSAYDGTPPAILDFQLLSPAAVNVTLAPATVDMQLVVQDSGPGGIDSIYCVVAQDPMDGQPYNVLSATYTFDTPVVGEAVTTNVSVWIPQYVRSGRYKIDITARDARGNAVNFNADQLANQSRPYFVDVVNAIEDLSPPQLLNLTALTSTTVNASSDMKFVAFSVSAQDDASGIVELQIRASLAEDGSFGLFDPNGTTYRMSPVLEKPVSFDYFLEAKQSTKPGRYLLSLVLGDAVGTYTNVDSDQLAAMNLPSFVDVVNPNYDGTPPVLQDLVLLSPSQVNVTLAPATVDMQLTLSDDVSRYKSGVVELWAYFSSDEPRSEYVDSNNPYVDDSLLLNHHGGGGRALSFSVVSVDPEYFVQNISHVVLAADSNAAVGNNESTTYSISLPIPQYYRAGAYGLHVILTDFADNVAYYDKYALSQQSLPFEIQIDNEIVDTEAPTVLNFTVNPSIVDFSASEQKPVSVNLTLTLRDAMPGAGVKFASVALAGPTTSYSYGNSSATWLDAPVQNEAAVFTFSFVLEPTLVKGKYNLEVSFADAAQGQGYLYSKDLAALGFPGTLLVK